MKIHKIATPVVALVIIGIALTLITFSALTSSQTVFSDNRETTTSSQNVSSAGGVYTSANLGLYSDSACTIPLSSVTWGNLTAGATTTQTIYVKNTGSGLSLTLSMTTSNWSAGANGPITLTWNKEGAKLNPRDSVTATLTLTISPSITDVTNFSVQINISGTN